MENESYEPDVDLLWDSSSPDAKAPPARFDGWTPFARKLFLSVLADTGRISLACEYTQRSRQSAYALRARDPIFAASWDAACELARAPLADALYERALDGVTETVTRNGEVIAERHRHDNRLSIAVLHRLDKRCDRAEERGARHLALLSQWHDWLDMVGKGEEQGAQMLLDSASPENARHRQLCQLPLGESPTVQRPTTLKEWAKLHPLAAPDDTDDDDDDDGGDDDQSHRCWKDCDGVWVTSFPPPPDFAGFRTGQYGDRDYERACTEEEAALLDAHQALTEAADRADEEALRDQWFDLIRQDLLGASGASADAVQRTHDMEKAG